MEDNIFQLLVDNFKTHSVIPTHNWGKGIQKPYQFIPSLITRHKCGSYTENDYSKKYQIDKIHHHRGNKVSYLYNFEIVGRHESIMVFDAECLKILADVLKQFGLSFRIKINHRKLLEGFNGTMPVINETYAPNKLRVLESMDDYSQNSYIVEAIGELEILFQYLQIYDVINYVDLDWNLKPDLECCTGIVFEVISQNMDQLKIIGGRCNNIIGFYGRQITSTKVFNDLDNIHPITNKLPTIIFIATNCSIIYAMEIATLLWNRNIPTDITTNVNKKLRKQLNYVRHNKIPYVIIYKRNCIVLKNMEKNNRLVIRRDYIVEDVMRYLHCCLF